MEHLWTCFANVWLRRAVERAPPSKQQFLLMELIRHALDGRAG